MNSLFLRGCQRVIQCCTHTNTTNHFTNIGLSPSRLIVVCNYRMFTLPTCKVCFTLEISWPPLLFCWVDLWKRWNSKIIIFVFYKYCGLDLVVNNNPPNSNTDITVLMWWACIDDRTSAGQSAGFVVMIQKQLMWRHLAKTSTDYGLTGMKGWWAM